jgi:hypothetical protein
VASPEFPFYGEPLDIRITIEGAIAENFTAPLGDQTEWLRKWGWIPLHATAARASKSRSSTKRRSTMARRGSTR